MARPMTDCGVDRAPLADGRRPAGRQNCPGGSPTRWAMSPDWKAGRWRGGCSAEMRGGLRPAWRRVTTRARNPQEQPSVPRGRAPTSSPRNSTIGSKAGAIPPRAAVARRHALPCAIRPDLLAALNARPSTRAGADPVGNAAHQAARDQTCSAVRAAPGLLGARCCASSRSRRRLRRAGAAARPARPADRYQCARPARRCRYTRARMARSRRPITNRRLERLRQVVGEDALRSCAADRRPHDSSLHSERLCLAEARG